jgi:hypothetical protein
MEPWYRFSPSLRAERSNPPLNGWRYGLLRRCAPRNDGGTRSEAQALLFGRRLARQSLGFQPFTVLMKGLLCELMFSHGLFRIAPSLGVPGLALLRRWLLTWGICFRHAVSTRTAPKGSRRVARWGEFAQSDQRDCCRPVSAQEINHFVSPPNHPYKAAVPPGKRGGSRSSRTRGGMRWTRGLANDERRPARTAKSCGPGAPTLALSPRAARAAADDGGKKARSPGRARRKPLKPLRREGRRCSGSPVVLPPCFLLHGAHGCNQHPAFPAPSL